MKQTVHGEVRHIGITRHLILTVKMQPRFLAVKKIKKVECALKMKPQYPPSKAKLQLAKRRTHIRNPFLLPLTPKLLRGRFSSHPKIFTGYSS
jgi:hypothetical protein